MSLRGKTLFITGASRGIGRSIALKAAKDGANIAVVAKTVEPHPKLPGTIFTVSKEIEQAGGAAIPIQCDIRDESQVIKAFEDTVKRFGAVDIVVNNASAISLTNTESTTLKKYDLMNQINARGTWLVSKKSENPHILNISPPLSLDPNWFAPHVAYTMAKYVLCIFSLIGMSEELRQYGIGVNALWPFTAIKTAALQVIGKKPEIMADAAYAILTKKSSEFTGKFCIDELVLRENGMTDFDQYSVTPGIPQDQLLEDFFLDEKLRDEVLLSRQPRSKL
ncbi:short chain dehydrogenase family protein [Basidiobolus meristosporus CBS 931.73]|uniref:Hydroxysteroid dehydrogenase-like protein 2 n=1 Tax=Basidiobolus meristosporus CBS 931.73 TaxID=1314790 RepID=A0A1Y1XAW4_9FUNG|nr:short chain dehydrogenase family protein [Basidiobolus meristosporus CBS 931.73]|eukprot:ORX82892.1 short chain dehydrogenase family protein [Basidiobolus meristosporus CBS 931.73]